MAKLEITPAVGASDPIRRQNDLTVGLGLISWGGQPVSAGVPTSQSVCGQAHYLYAGEIVTNIIVFVQTAAVGTVPTSLKLALWDSAATPNCLAVTAELKSDSRWTSQGWVVAALSSPYTITSSGIYYPAFWQNGAFGSTNLQVGMCNGSLGGSANIIGSGKRPYTALKTGATTMVATDTGSYSQTGAIPLFHIS